MWNVEVLECVLRFAACISQNDSIRGQNATAFSLQFTHIRNFDLKFNSVPLKDIMLVLDTKRFSRLIAWWI